MPPKHLEKIADNIGKLKEKMPFVPSLGPQYEAWQSPADILLFGGSGGGGKTALGVGLALIGHKRSLLMRRQGTELQGLTDEAIKFNGTKVGFNGSYPQKLRTREGRLIEFGSAQYPGDELKWRGIPHDYLYIDEAGEWLGNMIRNLIGWVRTTDEEQRCRVILGSNPPTSADGEWMVKMFAPWLDPTHAKPAEQGELRWFVMDDEMDMEVPGPGGYDITGNLIPPEQYEEYKKQNGHAPLRAMSRTFIRSKLENNPFLANTDYGARLDMLPEPLRSAVRDGNFLISRRDDSFQVIPTDWIRAAMARWQANPPEGVPMCAMGVDIAQGGDDKTVISTRYDGWYAPFVQEPGRNTPTGNEVAGLIVANRRDKASIVLDMGGGYGGATFLRLKDNGLEEDCVLYKGAAATPKRTQDGKLKFDNCRIAAYWKLREALDPAQPGGSRIMLPNDSELISDLTAVRFKQDRWGIACATDSTKEAVTKRLGRSPDKGDSVVMCWWGGITIANVEHGWGRNNSHRQSAALKVNVGYADKKRVRH